MMLEHDRGTMSGSLEFLILSDCLVLRLIPLAERNLSNNPF